MKTVKIGYKKEITIKKENGCFTATMSKHGEIAREKTAAEMAAEMVRQGELSWKPGFEENLTAKLEKLNI